MTHFSWPSLSATRIGLGFLFLAILTGWLVRDLPAEAPRGGERQQPGKTPTTKTPRVEEEEETPKPAKKTKTKQPPKQTTTKQAPKKGGRSEEEEETPRRKHKV